VTKYRAEILTAVAWLAGWALLTAAGGAVVQGAWVAAIWRGSAGLLLLALPGLKLLWVVLTEGLYSLTRNDP
jgi:hypothetical protein